MSVHEQVSKTNLQHMQQGSLSGIVKTKEQELRMLIDQAKRSKEIKDCCYDIIISFDEWDGWNE